MKNRNKLIVEEGRWPILTAAVIAALAWIIFGKWGLLPTSLIFIFVVSFFRNPERQIPQDPDAIVSPADGKVIFVGDVQEDRLLKGPAKKISIFMSVFNVHVNRAPFTGAVERVAYNPGKFLVASEDKASLDNEQNAVVLRSDQGPAIMFVQIAGFVARRIVCYLKAGDRIEKGRRFGLIMFGSRLDLYLPPDAQVCVWVGARVKGGSTIVGRMP